MFELNGFELNVYLTRPLAPSSKSIASKRNIDDSFGFSCELKKIRNFFHIFLFNKIPFYSSKRFFFLIK